MNGQKDIWCSGWKKNPNFITSWNILLCLYCEIFQTSNTTQIYLIRYFLIARWPQERKKLNWRTCNSYTLLNSYMIRFWTECSTMNITVVISHWRTANFCFFFFNDFFFWRLISFVQSNKNAAGHELGKRCSRWRRDVFGSRWIRSRNN